MAQSQHAIPSWSQNSQVGCTPSIGLPSRSPALRADLPRTRGQFRPRLRATAVTNMAGTEKRGSTEPRNTVTIGVTTQDSTSVWRELGLRSGTRQCQRVQVAKPVAASHDPSMDDAAFDNALIAAAFQLAAEQGWRRVSVVAAARAAGLPLARARERFPGRSAILLRFGRLADQAALAEAPSEGPVRDRLFDLLMRRIDALQTHRAGVLALLRALPAEPPIALLLALATRRSMRWMLAAGGIPTGGIHGELRVKGLLAVWLWTLRAWRADDGEDLGTTMAALDAALRRAEQAAGWLGWRAPEAEAPPDTGEPEETPPEGPPEAPA